MTAPAETAPETAPATTGGETAPEVTTTTTPPDPAATLDDKAQKVIEAIRGDFKTERQKRQAAEAKQSSIIEAVQKALGIDVTPDPAELSRQLTEQQSAARQAQVEVAVYRSAASAGANPGALLDSVAFLNAVKGVDPTDTESVTAAIKAAVEANPTLAAAPARRAPGPNPAAGSSANGAPGLDDQIAAAKKAGEWKTVLHLENQKLHELRANAR